MINYKYIARVDMTSPSTHNVFIVSTQGEYIGKLTQQAGRLPMCTLSILKIMSKATLLSDVASNIDYNSGNARVNLCRSLGILILSDDGMEYK